jgi:hypothetical protein
VKEAEKLEESFKSSASNMSAIKEKEEEEIVPTATVSRDMPMKTIEKNEVVPPLSDGTTVSVVYVSLLIILSVLYSQNSIHYCAYVTIHTLPHTLPCVRQKKKKRTSGGGTNVR